MTEIKTWVGTSIEDIGRGNGLYNFDVPVVSPSKHHAVLFELPVNLVTSPKPYRNVQVHHWDDDYVRMPFSANNLFPVKDGDGEEKLKSRWEIIQESLLQPITSISKFEAVINSYNTRLPKFLALHYFFEEVLEDEEIEAFFKTLLPGIIQLALQLPDILPGNLPLLKKETSASISLSQLQIASLLANAFLCTIPWRKDVSTSYPGVNFVRLFAAHFRPKRQNCIAEKLKNIFHYFRRVLSKAPIGVVTFERKYLHKNQVPRWDRIENNLGNVRVHIDRSGTIEDSGYWTLQVDFANKFVGGGVLGYGCVQEEIRYIICPELIISRLFTEELGAYEALLIMGVERYSDYFGYSDGFVWNGDYKDDSPYDKFGRKRTSIVAIDAMKFNKSVEQFYTSSLLRELNKAYVGFHSKLDTKLSPVATGNWGCGAYRGDPRLKFVLQLMACSAANRNMMYYTFEDRDLQDEIYKIYNFLAVNKVTISQLWRLLCCFVAAQLKHQNFFPFIQQAFFDSKKQPSILQMFSSNKNRETQLYRASRAVKSRNSSEKNNSVRGRSVDVPSTSMETDSPEDLKNISNPSQSSDSDIIETSQPEDEFKHFKYIKHLFEDKSSTEKHSDIISLINVIDGIEIPPEKPLSKDKNEFMSIDMDVSDLEVITTEVNVANDTQQKSPPNNPNKRKITDYFVKISK